MPVLEKNSTLTLLKIAYSITFTNFALAVGLYTLKISQEFHEKNLQQRLHNSGKMSNFAAKFEAGMPANIKIMY